MLGLNKLEHIEKNQNALRMFPHLFRGFRPNWAESLDKRLAPKSALIKLWRIGGCEKRFEMAASLFSLFSTLGRKEHQHKNRKRFQDKEPIDSVTKKESKIASHFSVGESSRAIHQTLGIYRGSLAKMQSQHCFLIKLVR